MTLPGGTPGRVAGRLVAGLLLLAVSTYYLLASVPFAYYHFLQFAHFAWLPWFVRFHAAAMAAGVVLLFVTSRSVSITWLRRLWLFGGLTTADMALVSALPVLQTYPHVTFLCFVPLALMAATALLELGAAAADEPATAPITHHPWLMPTAAAGLLVTVLYLIVGIGALRAATAASSRTIVAAALLSVSGHLGLFVLIAAGFALVARMSAQRGWAARTSALASAAWLAILMAFFVHSAAFSTLLMDDGYALILAVALGVSLSLFWVALRLNARPESRTGLLPVPDGGSCWPTAAVAAAALAICVFVLPPRLLLADWGGVLQKALVVAAWLSAVTLVRALPRRTHLPIAGVATLLLMGAPATGWLAKAPAAAEARPASASGLDVVVQQYTTGDRSMAMLLDLFRPVLTDREFFSTVAAEGDVTDRKGLAAVPLTVVPELRGVPDYRPHIFVFVFDSLRPDYLGAYRPAATALTPRIDAFAADSVIMRQAFTPYAGTALAQPAIWAGGLLPRLNYVQPFARLNNLERLVTTAGYRRYVSMDEISRVILDRQDEITNLDPALAHPERQDEMFKFDFCDTVGELTRLLDRDAADARPIFVYTQPQNLHIRVLADSFPKYEGVRIGGDEFFKPAATAIARVDGCFGTFIDALKARGLYDDSVIVLTSDHGDSYGEGGRWGHAFYLVPETLKIPLIVHVPERLKAAWTWDTDRPVLSTGITPTLYQLLGYGYEPSSSLVGRPYVSSQGQMPEPSQDAFLVQSSYSRAFGLLAGDARWMYAVNANQITEGYFLAGNGAALAGAELPDVERIRLRHLLLSQIRALNVYYAGHDKN